MADAPKNKKPGWVICQSPDWGIMGRRFQWRFWTGEKFSFQFDEAHVFRNKGKFSRAFNYLPNNYSAAHGVCGMTEEDATIVALESKLLGGR